MAGTVPLGYVDDAGFAYTGGYGELIDALLEYVPDLLWPMSVRTFAQMRMDSQLGGILKAYTLPIRRASWTLDPAGCRSEVVNFIADELGIGIKGKDPKPTGARRRNITWKNHLKTAATLALCFGHAPFERTYEYVDGKQRLGLLEERMPQTIAQIKIMPDGKLAGIVQNALAGPNPRPEIPAEALIWYSNEREGSNWTGRSLFRAAYAPWLIKHELWRVHATSIRRFGMGVPSVEAPPGATPAQVMEAQRLASAMRGGDQAGAGLPPGFRLNLTGITGSVPDALAFIKYLDEQMTHNTLTGLLDLGSTAHGSRALGDTFMDMFMLSLQAVADDFAEQATKQLVVPLVDLNWGEDEPAPQIVVSELGADREVTAETLKLLLDGGALKYDPDLEAYVREQYKLPIAAPELNPPPPAPPVAAPPVPPAPVEPAAEQSPASARAASARERHPRSRPQAVAGAGGFRRMPTKMEAASKADFHAIQQDWMTATAETSKAWAKVSAAQKAEVLAQIAQAVDSGDYSQLGNLTVDTTAAAALLADKMHDMAEQAMEQASTEIDKQGVSMTGTPSIDTDRLNGVAGAMAGILGAGFAAYAARSAIQNLAPGATGEDVSNAVGDDIDSLGNDALDATLGTALSAAQGEGRMAAFMAAPEAQYVASEIMDGNTCASCAEIDGHEYGSLDEASADYASGGYVDCEGGLRCRGILVAVFATNSDEEQP